MIIAIDFDGTCVKHEYPLIGEDCPGAVETLKELVLHGHQLILYTMRSEEELRNAIQWFIERGITLWSVNRNPQQDWTTSPKCYANLYIDDAALGCPLAIDDPDEYEATARPYVDWDQVRELLVMYELLPEKPNLELEIL